MSAQGERSPGQALGAALGKDLEVGELGVIAARPGIGKSALLVHLGLEAAMRGEQVLHVSLREGVDHVRAYYDELMASLARAGQLRERGAAQLGVERHRIIHSYLDRSFDVGHLVDNLEMLAHVAQFSPKLVLVDGFEHSDLAARVGELAMAARARGLVLWSTLRVAKGAPIEAAIRQNVRAIYTLEPVGREVVVARVVGDTPEELPFRLDPATMLLAEVAVGAPPRTGALLKASDCTLYSGGAGGAEEAFGQEAERWGCKEVNFTFEGHTQERTRGRHVLSPRELAAGDVSLVYVSRRLNRTYTEGSLIRKVLQTLWHMVSRSQQIFVIGAIQDDGTVVGGTGWSVELARMWNKALWVYDQDKHGWYQWVGEEWVPGTPVIESLHFAGAGTRYLTDSGRAAVADLFARSFVG